MFGPTPFRDIFLVAGFELREMARSRMIFLFTVLYLLVAAMLGYLFVNVLTRVQDFTPPVRAERRQFAPNTPPNVAPATPPEATPDPSRPQEKRLFQRGSPFRGIVSNSVDGMEAQEFLLARSPITLFHFFFSLLVVPLIIMCTASISIAREHQTRGVRFIGMRTGRAEFVIGKLLGQGATIAVMTLLAGAMCLVIGAWKLGDFELLPAIQSILIFWPRLLAYCIAFLGLAGLFSMISSSTISAVILSIVGMVALSIINMFAEVYKSGLPTTDAHYQVWNAIQFFTPVSYRGELWYPQFSHYGVAMGELALLGVIYVAIGLIFYRKRDL